MAAPQLLSLVKLLVLFSVELVFGEVVNLADSVQLTVKGSCEGGGVKLARVRITDGSAREVAALVGGVWKPAEEYKHRIHHDSSSSVNLTGVNFNDEAFYEFTCEGQPITTTQLTVIFPYDVGVHEGGNFTIPCHFSTDGLRGVSARWERNGELLLEQDLSSRLSMSPDRNLTGDMSLTVKGAQLEDGGDYVCYKVDGNGKKSRGTPAAVKVTVTKRSLGPLDSISQKPTQRPAEEQMGPGFIVSITFNVLLFIAAAIFCTLWRVWVGKSRRSGGARPRTDDAQLDPLRGDHVANGGPIERSSL